MTNQLYRTHSLIIKMLLRFLQRQLNFHHMMADKTDIKHQK